MNGFGGGKLLFPGIASIDTIQRNHITATDYLRERNLNSSQMTGNLQMRGMREEIEEMTRMAGQFFKVDCLHNSRLELIDLYAGDLIEEYYAAIPAAREVYGIEPVAGRISPSSTAMPRLWKPLSPPALVPWPSGPAATW